MGAEGARALHYGPIIRPNYQTIGPNKVTVPQWYYKIVVDYHRPEIHGQY